MGQTQDNPTAELNAAQQSSLDWAGEFEKVVEGLRPRSSHGRREQTRTPVSATFQLTPLDDAGHRLDDKALTVVGRNISPGGIAFRHERRFTQRRAILAFEHPRVGRLEVEAEILWTRLAEPGWYESGAVLVQTVEGHAIKTG